MDRRGDARAICATFVMAAVGALGAWGIVASEGCALKNCDPDARIFDDKPDFKDPDPGTRHEARRGQWIGPNMWQSAPIDGDWLPFAGQRNYIFNIVFEDQGKPLSPRVPVELVAYLAPTQLKDNRDETTDGYSYKGADAQFAVGAGNISEFFAVGLLPVDNARGLTLNIGVRNDSCASYLVRVLARFPDEPDSGPPPENADAGDAGDSSSSDAADASSTLDAGDSGPPSPASDAQNEEQ